MCKRKKNTDRYSTCCAVRCLVAQSCSTLCNPMDCSLPGSSVHGDSPGKHTGVDCHALLQRIFPTQGSNPGFPHCRRILNLLSHQGGPNFLTMLYPPAQQSTWHQEGLPETLTGRREEIYWTHSEEEERKGKESWKKRRQNQGSRRAKDYQISQIYSQ